MSDDAQPTAGRLLRDAREKQGLHVAALAASIRVPPKKLEALEGDRYHELPDATFARALALTVCRALKIDAAPVLALLPQHAGHRLEQVSQGLNTPFRERPASLLPGDWSGVLASPVLWVTALVLVATLLVYLVPGSVMRLANGSAASAASAPVLSSADASKDDASLARAASAAPAVSSSAASAATRASQPAAAPDAAVAAVPAGSDAAPFGAPTEGVLQVRVAETSWVEVVDARGVSLLARLLVPGESVGLDGTAPFRVRIGNAAATQVAYRGQQTDLQPFTRDNVARLELK